MFKILGLLLAIYTVHAVQTGTVYVKHRFSGRMVSKHEEPRYFWAVIVLYAFLSVMLWTVF